MQTAMIPRSDFGLLPETDRKQEIMTSSSSRFPIRSIL